MSRPIKFRAWSNEHNRYCDFVTLDENGRWIGWIKSSGVYLTTVDVILEQYTGLTDKNGKKIYEGDIVRYSFINPNRTYTELVSFGPIQDGEGYFHQEFLAWRTTYADDGTAHSSLLDLVEPNWTCEIISNIHENKDLLGGEVDE